MAKTVVKTGPAVQPLLLTDAKDHLNVAQSDTSFDTFINFAIKTATEMAENYMQRALITRSLYLFLDHFPGTFCWKHNCCDFNGMYGESLGYHQCGTAKKFDYSFEVPYPPVSKDNFSISYADPTSGVMTVLDPSQYDFDYVSQPAIVRPAAGVSWPSTYRKSNAIQVGFDCGFGSDESAVPYQIKKGICMTLGDLFLQRENIIVGAPVSEIQGQCGLSIASERLFSDFRIRY